MATEEEIRRSYAEEAFTGVPRWGYFCRADVGTLLGLLDAERQARAAEALSAQRALTADKR